MRLKVIVLEDFSIKNLFYLVIYISMLYSVFHEL